MIIKQGTAGAEIMKPGFVRKVTVAAATSVLAIGLCACQSATSDRAASSASTAVSAGSTATGHQSIPDSAFAFQKPFTGQAVEKYGQAALRAAFEEMVNFAFDTGWNPALFRKNYAHLARADLANARVYMTPACLKTFDATFAKVVQADKAAIQKLEEAMFFGVTGPNGMTPLQQGHVVTDRKFTEAAVGLDRTKGAERLSMAFAAKANIQLQDSAGKRYALPTSRVMRYLLVQNTGPDRQRRPFLVDSWAIKMTVSHTQAAK